MKKTICLILGAIMIFCLTACAGILHCKDCDDKVYKDGYCEYHYTMHQAQDKVDSMAKELFDGIVGG